MNEEKTPPLLDRLESSLRADSAQMRQLEAELTLALHRASALGAEQGGPAAWAAAWNDEWAAVEEILTRFRRLLDDIGNFIEGGADDRLARALESWKSLQAEDHKLVTALGSLQRQVSGLNASVYKDWNLLVSTLELHFRAIRTCAEGLRVKMEFLKKHEVALTAEAAEDPKQVETGQAPAQDAAFQQAAAELKREHEEFPGLMGVVQALFMWVETPEERVDKIRALDVTQP